MGWDNKRIDSLFSNGGGVWSSQRPTSTPSCRRARSDKIRYFPIPFFLSFFSRPPDPTCRVHTYICVIHNGLDKSEDKRRWWVWHFGTTNYLDAVGLRVLDPTGWSVVATKYVSTWQRSGPYIGDGWMGPSTSDHDRKGSVRLRFAVSCREARFNDTFLLPDCLSVRPSFSSTLALPQGQNCALHFFQVFCSKSRESEHLPFSYLKWWENVLMDFFIWIKTGMHVIEVLCYVIFVITDKYWYSGTHKPLMGYGISPPGLLFQGSFKVPGVLLYTSTYIYEHRKEKIYIQAWLINANYTVNG